jgi:hypothetical protein
MVHNGTTGETSLGEIRIEGVETIKNALDSRFDAYKEIDPSIIVN